MAFREESEDTFSAIKEVCEERGLKWARTDQDPTTNRVYQRIVGGIQRAAFVIADATIPTLNVYYELGYAEALVSRLSWLRRKAPSYRLILGTSLPRCFAIKRASKRRYVSELMDWLV